MDCPGLPEFVRASVALRTGAEKEKEEKKAALARCRAAKEAIDELFEKQAKEGETLCIDDEGDATYVRRKKFKGSRKLKEDDIREAVLAVDPSGQDESSMKAAVLEALRTRAATERTRIVVEKAPSRPEARSVPAIKTLTTQAARKTIREHKEAAEGRKKAHAALKEAQQPAKDAIERTKEAVMAGLDGADGGTGFTEVPVSHPDGRFVLRLKQRRKAARSKTKLKDIVEAAWADAGVQIRKWKSVRNDFCAKLQARMIVTTTYQDLSLDIDRSKPDADAPQEQEEK